MRKQEFDYTLKVKANVQDAEQHLQRLNDSIKNISSDSAMDTKAFKKIGDSIDKLKTKLNQPIKSPSVFNSLSDETAKIDTRIENLLGVLEKLKTTAEGKISLLPEGEQKKLQDATAATKAFDKAYETLLKNRVTEEKKAFQELQKTQKKQQEIQNDYDSKKAVHEQYKQQQIELEKNIKLIKTYQEAVKEYEEKGEHKNKGVLPGIRAKVKGVLGKDANFDNDSLNQYIKSFEQQLTTTKTSVESTGDKQARAEAALENAKLNAEKAARAYNALREANEKLGDSLDKNDIAKISEDYKKLRKSAGDLGVKLEGISENYSPEGAMALRKALGDLTVQGVEKADAEIEDLIKQLIELRQANENCQGSILETKDAMVQQNEAAARVQAFTDRIKAFVGLQGASKLMGRAFRDAYATVKDLDSAMAEMAMVTDQDIGDYWKQLPEYTERANKLGVSIKSAYESATLFYQQGLKTNEVNALSVNTLRMAEIANLDAAEATNRMTAALRGFNMELTEANSQRVADVYSELAAVTAADVDEISTAMGKTASIASSANMEFETTAAFLSQIIETTREAPDTAGTALKTIIARFQELKKDPSLIGEVDGEIVDANKIETALRSVGVALRDSSGQFRDLDDVFLELSKKWDGLDLNTQRYIATIAAGSRQQSRFIAMMSDYARTQELVNAANNSAGASEEQHAKKLDSLESKLAKLKNAWDNFIMGLTNNKVIKFGVDVMTKLLEAINKATEGFGDFTSLLSKAGMVLSIFKIGEKVYDKFGLSLVNKFEKWGTRAGQSFGQAVKQQLDITESQIKVGEDKTKVPYQENKGFKQTFKDVFGKEDMSKIITEEDLAPLQSQYLELSGNTDQAKKKWEEYVSKIKSGSVQAKAALNEMEKEIRENGEASDEAKDKFSKSTSETKDKIGPTADEKRIEGIKKMGSAMQAAGMAANFMAMGIASIGNSLEKDGVEGASKRWGEFSKWISLTGTVLMTLGMFLPMLGGAFVKTGASAAAAGQTAAAGGTAAQIAWWPLLLITLAIVATLVLIVTIVKAFNFAVTDSQKRVKKAKKAYEESEEALNAFREAAEKTKTELDNLKEGLESLEESGQELKYLTQGTKEWTEAVRENNQQVIDLIGQYKELAQYVTTANGVMSLKDENGEIDKIIANKKAESLGDEMAVQMAELEKVRASYNLDLENLSAKTITKSDNAWKRLTTAQYWYVTNTGIQNAAQAAGKGESVRIFDEENDSAGSDAIDLNNNLEEIKSELISLYNISEDIKNQEQALYSSMALTIANAVTEGMSLIDQNIVYMASQNSALTEYFTQKEKHSTALMEDSDVQLELKDRGKTQEEIDDLTEEGRKTMLAGLRAAEDLTNFLQGTPKITQEVTDALKNAGKSTTVYNKLASGKGLNKSDLGNLAQYGTNEELETLFNSLSSETRELFDYNKENFVDYMNFLKEEESARWEKISDSGLLAQIPEMASTTAAESLVNLVKTNRMHSTDGQDIPFLNALGDISEVVSPEALEIIYQELGQFDKTDLQGWADFETTLNELGYTSFTLTEQFNTLKNEGIKLYNAVNKIDLSKVVENFKSLTQVINEVRSGDQGTTKISEELYKMIIGIMPEYKNKFEEWYDGTYNYLGKLEDFTILLQQATKGSVESSIDLLNKQENAINHLNIDPGFSSASAKDQKDIIKKWLEDDSKNKWLDDLHIQGLSSKSDAAYLEDLPVEEFNKIVAEIIRLSGLNYTVEKSNLKNSTYSLGYQQNSVITNLGLRGDQNYLNTLNEEQKQALDDVIVSQLSLANVSQELISSFVDGKITTEDLNKAFNELRKQTDALTLLSKEEEQNSIRRNEIQKEFDEGMINSSAYVTKLTSEYQESIEDNKKAREELSKDIESRIPSMFSEYITKDGSNNYTIDYDKASKEIENPEMYNSFLETAELIKEDITNLQDLENVNIELFESLEETIEKAEDVKEDLLNRTRDALISLKKDSIDELKSVNSSIQETNTSILSKIQQQISEERQNRENEKQAQEIADKESYLAYLKSTGSSPLEIMELEKEIADQRQTQSDNLIDQHLQKLEDANDAAAQQREEQIAIAELQLEQYENSQQSWQDAQETLNEALTGETGNLYSLLQKPEGVATMSEAEREEWTKSLNASIETSQALDGLKQFFGMVSTDEVENKTTFDSTFGGTMESAVWGESDEKWKILLNTISGIQEQKKQEIFEKVVASGYSKDAMDEAAKLAGVTFTNEELGTNGIYGQNRANARRTEQMEEDYNKAITYSEDNPEFMSKDRFDTTFAGTNYSYSEAQSAFTKSKKDTITEQKRSDYENALKSGTLMKKGKFDEDFKDTHFDYATFEKIWNDNHKEPYQKDLDKAASNITDNGVRRWSGDQLLGVSNSEYKNGKFKSIVTADLIEDYSPAIMTPEKYTNYLNNLKRWFDTEYSNVLSFYGTNRIGLYRWQTDPDNLTGGRDFMEAKQKVESLLAMANGDWYETETGEASDLGGIVLEDNFGTAEERWEKWNNGKTEKGKISISYKDKTGAQKTLNDTIKIESTELSKQLDQAYTGTRKESIIRRNYDGKDIFFIMLKTTGGFKPFEIRSSTFDDKNGDTKQALITLLSNKDDQILAYKTGGLADYTGPAWLDGTPSKPELVLNARDTQNFIQLKDILSEVMSDEHLGSADGSNEGGDNYFDIDINVDTLTSDYDVEQLSEKIKESIYEDSMYRNVNSVSWSK